MDLGARLERLGHEQVAGELGKLGGDAALIEFIRFPPHSFHVDRTRQEHGWGPDRYAAFIVLANGPEPIRLVDLGEAAPIDQRIAGFRALAIKTGPRDLAARQEVSGLATGSSDGLELRRALLDPLVGALNGRTRLLIASDGDLSRLPFGLLPADEGGWSWIGTGSAI